MTVFRSSEPHRSALPMGEQLFQFSDRVGGVLLLAAIALAPWLFGTTEVWSVWTLNSLGYCGGLSLLLKWFLRWRSGALAVERIWREQDPVLRPGTWMVRAMGVLTLLVLFYCLVAALNARATFYPEEHRLEYRRYIPWLPFTYDSRLTWRTFWSYLALACFFWGVRDWLLHPPRAQAAESEVVLGLPPRFQTFFWVVAVNTTLLALEGTFQRLSGTDKLLWMRRGYSDAHTMFGPYAFHGNAAQYFNLAWPLIVGFWWTEREKARLTVWAGKKLGGGPHIILLLCAIISGAAPMVATSQGGTLVTLALLVGTAFIFLVHRRGSWRTRCVILLVCLGVVSLGGALGWDQLAPRLRDVFRTRYANPNELYENARQMALDYPVLGIGPGAFRALYPLYRKDAAQSWQAFLHDDWLETRVTFGWVGSMLILCLLGVALTRWFIPGGVFGQWELVAMLWVSVGGCLAHAKFSFPLQVYSILCLLLAELAVLSALSRPER
ncbi:MAG TPA: O-antigen ligase family protein [Verrucomicrobiae bacterium]|nr:O-antigen ligase family protein [Verrucomicrobiae bacterium]